MKELFNVSHNFLVVSPIHKDVITTRNFSFESMLKKLFYKVGVGRKRKFLDRFLCENVSHFFTTKSRLLKVV